MQIKILIYFVVSKICSLLADLTFTILHDNDAYARFGRTTVTSSICPDHARRKSCVGGFARAAHVIRQHRQWTKDGKNPLVVYLTTGDIDISFGSYGERWYQVNRWKILAEMMNAVRPDAMTLAKQELNDSPESVKQFVQKTDFSIVMSNGNFLSNKKLQRRIRNSCTLKIGGKEVGIIGYRAELEQKHLPGSSFHFPEELATIREESERLAAEGVDTIIALFSVRSRYNEEYLNYLPLVDIFIGGHNNSLLYTGCLPSSSGTPESDYPTLVVRKNGHTVPIAYAFATCNYIGFLNVTFDDKGNLKSCTGNPIYLSNAIPQEEDVLKKVNKHRSKKSAVRDRVIGMGKVLLEGGEKCRKEECVLGNLIADALVAMSASSVKSEFWTTHSIGLINGGSIKFSIDPRNRDGKITYGDVLKALPAANEVVKLSIRGKYLKDVFEDILKNDEPKEILQVSGLQITFDLEQPSGKHVVRMKARCGNCRVPVYENVTDKNTYNIVTTDYVLNHHDSLRRNHFNRKNEEHNSRESVVWYIGAHSPVIIEIGGRLTFSRGAVAEFNCSLSFIMIVCYISCTQYFSLFI